ncbi:hypothetical protein NQ317_006764 [Molorchus minor]|uniref:Uncharacterized protein n=1 Tax=Molorchus minor TaxID=1323400 RepID=A0ABQ9JMJ8_9CUCU|nr:hypothetical protein NQ317_006764 [Molorchus minor]
MASLTAIVANLRRHGSASKEIVVKGQIGHSLHHFFFCFEIWCAAILIDQIQCSVEFFKTMEFHIVSQNLLKKTRTKSERETEIKILKKSTTRSYKSTAGIMQPTPTTERKKQEATERPSPIKGE